MLLHLCSRQLGALIDISAQRGCGCANDLAVNVAGSALPDTQSIVSCTSLISSRSSSQTFELLPTII